MSRIFILVIFLTGLTGSNASAYDSIIDQIQRLKPAIVGVKSVNTNVYKGAEAQYFLVPGTGKVITRQNVRTGTFERYGAGVNIHPSGIIVTNAHIIHRANYIYIVLRNNVEVPARLVRYEGNLDFALLKVDLPYPLPSVPLADSDLVELRDEIITVGNSWLLKESMSGGRVIGIGQRKNRVNELEPKVDLIQMNINAYRGDSGGPVFNKKGELVGLMTAKENSSDRSTFAIPSRKIRIQLEGYLKEAGE